MSALTWSAAYPYYSAYDERYYESQDAADRAERAAEQAEREAAAAEQSADASDRGISYDECENQYDCPDGNCPPACDRFYN